MSSKVMKQAIRTKTVSGDAGKAGQPAGGARARDRIFAAAREMFYRQGIRAVGVESIVAAAGATKMSLYRSFPSKDELVAAYLKERDAVYWQWWDNIMERHAGDPRAQLRALVEIGRHAHQAGRVSRLPLHQCRDRVSRSRQPGPRGRRREQARAARAAARPGRGNRRA